MMACTASKSRSQESTDSDFIPATQVEIDYHVMYNSNLFPLGSAEVVIEDYNYRCKARGDISGHCMEMFYSKSLTL